jgi:serine/threonine protein kinase
MAPERLSERRYGSKADVWSLGLTLVEICIGKFPYSWNTVFDQLRSVVHEDPPFLSAGDYSLELVSFTNQCLIKDTNSRPRFSELMMHPFFQQHNFTNPISMNAEREKFGAYVRRFVQSWEQQNEQSVVRL